MGSFSIRLIAVIIAALVGVALSGTALGQTGAVQYLEDETLFPNPERGFYAHRQANTALGPPLTVADLRSLRRENITLVLRIYYFKAFREAPLSQTQLNLIEADFNTLREAGSKAILRFAYSSSSSEADAPMSTIQTHIEQLAPLFREHSDVIAVVQAGFIGAWGEWYYSSNNLANTVNRRQVTYGLLDALPSSRMVQVRTPNYKRAILGPPQPPPLTEEQAFTGEPIARIAHHNDCFLASQNDYGTYQNIGPEKIYLEQETRYLAMGGETCAVSEFSGCQNALVELERFKWSYLNQGYHADVLRSWENQGCMQEVRRRLGYRFALTAGHFDRTVEQGGGFVLDLEIANSGFAAPFNPRLVEVIFRQAESGEEYAVVLPDDPRFWLGGDTVSVSASIGVPSGLPAGEYRIFLNLPDGAPTLRRRPEFSIRLANLEAWEESTGYNDLQMTITVAPNTSGSSYDGQLWLRPIADVTSSEPDLPASSGSILRGPYPNPFTSTATIQVQPPHSQHVRVTLHDLTGRSVKVLHDGFLAGGTSHSVRLSGSRLAPGVYFVRATGEGIRETQSAVLVR